MKTIRIKTFWTTQRSKDAHILNRSLPLVLGTWH